MKAILSRKGFNSAFGGYPSPILPGGEMVSLPIPSKDSIRSRLLGVNQGGIFNNLSINLLDSCEINLARSIRKSL